MELLIINGIEWFRKTPFRNDGRRGVPPEQIGREADVVFCNMCRRRNPTTGFTKWGAIRGKPTGR